MRPKLPADLRSTIALLHLQTLDAISTGNADADTLWRLAGAAYTWCDAAEALGTGVDVMREQVAGVLAVAERFRRTGRIGFTGPEYQQAQARHRGDGAAGGGR